MSKEPKQRPPSALSQTLKIYRDTHKWSQELAALLEVEPRTLRRWENSETILSDMHELKRIADRLGIAYEVTRNRSLSLHSSSCGNYADHD